MPSLFVRETQTLFTAIMFLTRLPVGRWSSGEAAMLSQSVRYFPFVGLLLASILSLLLWCSLQLLPMTVAVALLIVGSVLLTGAFHEDGLADLADSAGAFDLDRKLEIMRDSRIGTYGALGLILLVLMRFTVLWEMLQLSLPLLVAGLITALSLARWASVYLMATINYARPEAANRVVAEGVTRGLAVQSLVCVVVVLVPAAYLYSPVVYALIPVAWLSALACGRFFKASLAGVTGDCLGAANQVTELVCLVALLAVALKSMSP